MRLFGDISDHALKAGQIVVDAVTLIENLAFRRLDQAGQHFDGRALSGAVGTQISENLAGCDGEADLMDSRDVAVMLGETAGFEHVHVPVHPTPRSRDL